MLYIDANIATSITLVLVHLQLWLGNRQTYLLSWAAAWASTLVRFVVELVAARGTSVPEELLLVGTFTFLSWVLLLDGLLVLTRRPTKERHLLWWSALGATLVLLSLRPLMEIDRTSLFSASFVLLGLTQVAAGAVFVTNYKRLGSDTYIWLGSTMAAWGVLRIAYPFLYQAQLFQHEIYLTSASCSVMVALCMAVLSVDHAGHRFRLVCQRSRDIILLMKTDGSIVEANDAASKAYGYSRQELIALNIRDLRWGASNDEISEQIEKAAAEGMLFEATHRCKDGSLLPVEVSSAGAAVGQDEYLVSIVRDLSEKQKLQRQIALANKYDLLTGLGNRALFEAHLVRTLGETPNQCGIILADIDGLRLVNESLGHQCGDDLLIATAGLIRNLVAGRGAAYRVGGDEFAAVFQTCTPDELDDACQRLRSSAEECRLQTDAPIKLFISVGYGHSLSASDAEALFGLAEGAVHLDKLHHEASSHSAIAHTLIEVLRARDGETESHTERLEALVARMGVALGLQHTHIDELRLLARFHDIGKVGVRDSILLKEGPLSPSERKEMQRHPEIGSRIAQQSKDLRPIADWVLRHHEWWNGQGYPLGLKGESIPLECRLLSIADAFDAMTSTRPYRQAMSASDAMSEIRRCAGSQFDPGLVEKLDELLSARVYERLAAV